MLPRKTLKEIYHEQGYWNVIFFLILFILLGEFMGDEL